MSEFFQFYENYDSDADSITEDEELWEDFDSEEDLSAMSEDQELDHEVHLSSKGKERDERGMERFLMEKEEELIEKPPKASRKRDSDDSSSDSEEFIGEEDSDVSSLDFEESEESYRKLLDDLMRMPQNPHEEDDDFESLRQAIQKSMIGSGKKPLIPKESDIKFNAIVSGTFPQSSTPSRKGITFFFSLQMFPITDIRSTTKAKLLFLLLCPSGFQDRLYEDEKRKAQVRKRKEKKAMAFARDHTSMLMKTERLFRKFAENDFRDE